MSWPESVAVSVATGPFNGGGVFRSMYMSMLSTHQNSPGQSLGGYHNAGPVFDRRHPAHLAGRCLRLFLTAGLDCAISLNVPWIGHFLLKQTMKREAYGKYVLYVAMPTAVQNRHFNGIN